MTNSMTAEEWLKNQISANRARALLKRLSGLKQLGSKQIYYCP
jgi:hypothetical protein